LERIVGEEQRFYLERSEELLMLGEFDAAFDAMKSLPRVQQTVVGDKIEAGRASYEEAKRQERVATQSAGKTAQKAREEARKQRVVLAFAEVQRKFNGEDWRRAADECDRVIAEHSGDAEIRKRAKALQRQIPEFGQAYDEGAKKYRAGQIAASAVPLAKARALYLKIGFPSAVDGSLKEMLSQASLLAGEDALARGNYAAAADHFSEALKLQPTSERARRGLARVAEKAEELFAIGYSLRSSNPGEARRYFDLIVKITPRGSHWYERAQNQMSALPAH
jgi:tetratricopeptide (TPR) repeat protein